MRMKPIDLKKTMEEMEEHLLLKAMRSARNNQVKAAQLLQIKRTTLRNKLKKYGIKGNKYYAS